MTYNTKVIRIWIKDIEGLVFGGAYIRRGLSTEGNLRFKIDRASTLVGSKLPFLLCSTLNLRAIFQVQAPPLPGGGCLEGRFNGRVFCVTGLWGVYMEGLIFGILRYLLFE